MKTTNPGKQRKALYNAPLHKRRKIMSSHLDENLLLKYDKRSVPVVKGDTVRVVRGSFRGHEDKVAKIHTNKNTIDIEGITMAKADGNKIPKPIHPSNVIITKLNLTDKWRRSKLERNLSEDTKKEIEKEAAEQIKQVEEEQKRLEEELAKQEAEKEKEELEEEVLEEQVEKPKEPAKKTEEEKTSTKKTEIKPKTEEKKTTDKKPAAKKETKPKTEKKTPEKKTTAKKEEE